MLATSVDDDEYEMDRSSFEAIQCSLQQMTNLIASLREGIKAMAPQAGARKIKGQRK
jgi:hypothetical protein